jgi:hypothetical protein
MTRPQKPNIRRAMFRQECFNELEQYLKKTELELNHQEFLLDLAALVDFLESENYIGAHYLACVLEERLKTKIPEWGRAAKLHVPKEWGAPDIQLSPEN